MPITFVKFFQKQCRVYGIMYVNREGAQSPGAGQPFSIGDFTKSKRKKEKDHEDTNQPKRGSRDHVQAPPQHQVRGARPRRARPRRAVGVGGVHLRHAMEGRSQREFEYRQQLDGRAGSGIRQYRVGIRQFGHWHFVCHEYNRLFMPAADGQRQFCSGGKQYAYCQHRFPYCQL